MAPERPRSGQDLPEGTVTFLVTDIEGSTRLLQQLGQEYGAALQRHREIVRRAVGEASGLEARAQGDGFFVAFARARDAVAAAVRITRELALLPPTAAGPLRVRIGLHTGQPTLLDGDYVGLDAHRAARICQAGHGGQILVSQTTRDLVEHDLPTAASLRDLGVHRLKDLDRPEHLFQVVVDGVLDRFPPLRSVGPRPNNLPLQLTNFIGRDGQIAEVLASLADHRLLTLTGPGGSGKTRLALEAAARVVARPPEEDGGFEDGVFLVELAPIFDPRLVVPTVAKVVGVPDVRGRAPFAALCDSLRDRRMLLLLDNFEQVLDAGPEVASLLATCLRVRVLATSRIPLRVSGERELAVPPLSLPAAGDRGEPGEILARSEAIRLFVERARELKSDFELTRANVAAVVEICRRLDGLPLAIELATARIRLLSPAAMLERLGGAAGSGGGSSLRLLTGGARDLPPRQQTLRAAIAWSYDLLVASEQALFRRIAVFVGGCTLPAIEAAGQAASANRRWALTAEEVLDGVESLLAKNLLRRVDTPGDEPRCSMLETIREFGLECLAESGELRAHRSWHAGYYARIAADAEERLTGPEQRAWLDRLEADHDNLRAALEWSLAEGRDPDLALTLSGALSWFWACRGYVTEGRRWLSRALDADGAGGPARPRALAGAGWLAHIQRDAPAARRYLGEALLLARRLRDRRVEAWSLHLLGRVAYFGGDAQTARRLAEESLAVARAVQDRWLIAWAVHLLGLAAHIAGELDRARACYDEALAIRRSLGYQEGISICLNLLGLTKYQEGDYAAAHALTRESLLLMWQVGVRWSVHNALAMLATLAGELGQDERSVRLAGAVKAFSETVDVSPIPLVEGSLGPVLEKARGRLGAERYEAAWTAGRVMSFEEAVAEALAVEPKRSAVMQKRAANPARLSPRELEILSLVAAGRTSKEIAEELVLSVRTVERHLSNIYAKINVRGRVEAAAFALRQGLAPGAD